MKWRFWRRERFRWHRTCWEERLSIEGLTAVAVVPYRVRNDHGVQVSGGLADWGLYADGSASCLDAFTLPPGWKIEFLFENPVSAKVVPPGG